MNRIARFSVTAALLLALFTPAPPARAQAGQATLAGTVTDSSGALISGATATLTSQTSGTTRTSVADSRGVLSFVGVPPATYTLQVAAPGFRSLRRTGIEVHINDQLELKTISLLPASTDVTVTVTSQTADVTPTTSGEQSYTLTGDQIQNLNIESRSAIELLDLIPGAANTGNFTGTYNRQQAGFGQNSSTYTVNGNRFDQVQIVSDGAPVTDLNTSGAAAVTPNVDMISEAKVETSAFSAVQPNGPIVFETQTKSGGNHFHGEAYLTARNHIFDANDAYNKQLKLPKANSSYYYPGFNIGGPVLFPGTGFNRNRNKLFFFAAAEFTQQHVDLGPQAALVPTAAMRTGIFSTAELNGLSGGANSYNHFYQSNAPCTGNYYNSPSCSNGKLLPSAIDKGGLILLNLFPLPNVDPLTTPGNYNLVTDFVTSDPRNQENLKLDYTLNDRTHLSGRFNHENENVPAPYGPYNTVNYAKIPYPASQTGRNASNSGNFNLTNTITNSLTNELTVAYTRLNLRIDIPNLAAVSRSALGFPYANLLPGSDVVPNINFTNASGLYLGGGETPVKASIQNTSTVTDGLTKQLGNHLLRAGFYGVLARFNNQTSGDDNGTIYPRTYVSGSTGNEFADLLVGRIGGFDQTSRNITASMVNKRFDFYAQDTWKASSKLTLNYGARLDHIAWWYDKNGRIAVFNPAAYDPKAPISAVSGFQTHLTNPAIDISGRQPLKFQFAPSVGFAYDVYGRGETIFRGGFGTNYYVDPGINAASAVSAPPNTRVVSFFTGSGTPFTLSQIAATDLSAAPNVVYGSASPSDHAPAVTYSWNVAVAQLLPAAIHFEISYVGNTTRHLNGYTATNLIPLGSETINNNGGPYYGGSYYDKLYRPYKSYGAIGTNLHNLNSNYNSLQVTASRAKGPVRTWLTYTYGKALAFNCEDSFNPHNCYSPAPFDRSQAINLSYYLILPSISQKHLGNHLLGNALLDGWQVSGIEQYGSGTPFTDIAQGGTLHNEYGGNQVIGIYGSYPVPAGTTSSGSSYGATNVNISSESVTGTPDEAAVPIVTCDPSTNLKPHQYFNSNCFTAPSAGHNGTFRLPYIHGPAYFNDELGLFKDFKVREFGKLQLRFQGFNFLNRSFDTFQQYDQNLYLGFNNINTPAQNVATAGTTNTRVGHRTLQAAAKFFF